MQYMIWIALLPIIRRGAYGYIMVFATWSKRTYQVQYIPNGRTRYSIYRITINTRITCREVYIRTWYIIGIRCINESTRNSWLADQVYHLPPSHLQPSAVVGTVHRRIYIRMMYISMILLIYIVRSLWSINIISGRPMVAGDLWPMTPNRVLLIRTAVLPGMPGIL